MVASACKLPMATTMMRRHARRLAKNPNICLLGLTLIHAMIVVSPKQGVMHALWTAIHVLELNLYANVIARARG